jgi:hypothetical protein
MSAKQLTLIIAMVIAVAVLLLNACGSKGSGFVDPNGSSGGAGADSGVFDTTKDGSAVQRPPVVGWLRGKVVAPEGTIPVSNAIVYLTPAVPEVIPGSAYCDTCVHLTALEPYAYTKSDGTFELGAYATGNLKLVVQKGQFRRIRDITVTTGDQGVPLDFTRLPSKTDPTKGDTIPKIAMVIGGYDHVDESLKKLGVEDFYRYGDGPFGSGGPGIATGKTGTALMASGAELAGYHVTLLPCAAMGYSQPDNGGFLCGAPTDAEKTAFKGYVQSGGKLYVTDFAYEAVRQTWPGYITFYDALMSPLDDYQSGVGTACRGGAEDTPGKAEDTGLASWMTAIGENDIQLMAAWSRIAKVSPKPGVDAAGKPVTITPKVWMTTDTGEGVLPATVSFEDKCGRVLFSTYHCEGDAASGLLAQEKALLYVLLEVGVCVGQLPPPPPPR